MEKSDGVAPLSWECRSQGHLQELWEFFRCHCSLPVPSCSAEWGASTARDPEMLLLDPPRAPTAVPHPCGYPKPPATPTPTHLGELAGHPEDEHTLQTIFDKGTQHPLQLVDPVPEKSEVKGAARHPDLLRGESWSVASVLACERSSSHRHPRHAAAGATGEVLPEHWEEQSGTLSGAAGALSTRHGHSLL